MKRAVMAVLIAVSMIIAAGCWDRKELGEITVITGMAIDKGEERKYLLSVEGINARELNPKTADGLAPSIVFSMEGDSIAELSKKMNVGLSRHLIYSHMKVVVIGEDVAREGMMEFVDYLERNREVRDDFNFLIARGTKAKDIFKITYQFQKASSLKLFTQLKTMEKEWGGNPDVRLNDVIDAWTSPGRQPVMQAVRIKGDPNEGNKVENMMKAAPDAIVVADSMAVFKGAKLKGFMNSSDARNYLWTQGELKQTSVTGPCTENKKITVRIYNSSEKMKADLIRGRAKMTVRIQAIGYIEGVQCPVDLSKAESYEKLGKLAEDQIRREIAATIKKAQQAYKADIFGFGEALFREHPAKFRTVEKNWDDVFSTGDVDVKVEVNIRRSGIRTKSFLEDFK